MIETIVYGLFLAAACVLRALCSLWAIDPATGFYEGHALLILVQDALFIAGSAAFLIWGRLQKKSRWRFPNAWVRGVPLAAAGAALAVCSAVSLMQGLLRFTEGDSSVGLSGLLAQALGIAAGLILAGASMRLCRGKRNGCGILPAAFPALYMAAMAVSRFLSYPTAYTISDQLLEICALCAGTFFFLAHARVLAGMRTDCVSYARGWGLCFSLLALPLCLSQQLAAGVRGGLMMGGADRLLLAVLALYAGIFSCALFPAREPGRQAG